MNQVSFVSHHLFSSFHQTTQSVSREIHQISTPNVSPLQYPIYLSLLSPQLPPQSRYPILGPQPSPSHPPLFNKQNFPAFITHSNLKHQDFPVQLPNARVINDSKTPPHKIKKRDSILEHDLRGATRSTSLETDTETDTEPDAR